MTGFFWHEFEAGFFIFLKNSTKIFDKPFKNEYNNQRYKEIMMKIFRNIF